jgi:kumamolisin
VKTSKSGIVMLLAVLAVASVAKAQSLTGEAIPFPDARTPMAIDRGALSAQPNQGPISVTVALSLPGAQEAEGLLKAISTPGDPHYRQFLSAEEFAARFAPTQTEVAKVVAGLAKYGLSAQRTSATTLRVTGMPGAMENAFGVTLHSYEVAAHGIAPGYVYHAPLNAAKVPAALAGTVLAVVGLDSRPSLRPHSRQALHGFARLRQNTGGTATTSGNSPGTWTVTDFANYYHVQPLYKHGLTGSGRTMGILTLASFTPSDAYAYWSAVGLTVTPHRIHVVNVDGGPGAPSDASGSTETTLDVEQSGGVAPGAKIIVYQAPNTTQAFLDTFACAVEANEADSLSTSWGAWEWFYNLENNPVADPTTGRTAGFTTALHEILLRAAIQGQTIYAASLDNGAYMVNGALSCFPSTTPSCNLALSVDYPASDPAITGTGATTLAGAQQFCLNTACTPPYFTLNIAQERVWSWDYLVKFCKTIGYDPISCGIFPVGSGGGVSVSFAEPWYQEGVAGVQRSQPGQYFVYDGQLQYALPPHYAGRNVPDISANGDPDTGYLIYYTSDVDGPEILSFWGGTSFVAPQMNGVTGLLGEEMHSRLGLLNYALYDLASSWQGYRGLNAPLNAIPYGDNWFYMGSDGYNPAVGVGTPDVANLAEYLQAKK